MQYLVTMTTHVPDGTSEETVQEMRDKEAAHSRQLVTQGHLLRLWRPPLKPGEWRTLGLFAAQDEAQLDDVLKSMPLRVWRTDEVTPLSPHPNDPVPRPTDEGQDGGPISAEANGGAKEFLTTFNINVPEGTARQLVDDAESQEAKAAHKLAQQGRLERLWTLPGEGRHRRVLGLWRCEDEAELKLIVGALPLADWMTVDITQLSPHPSDPVFLSRSGRE
jgi:muconolactone delta-isomerase